MNATTKTVVGVDTAKQVFQLHWVDAETGEVFSKRLKRAKFLEHFVNKAACLIGTGGRVRLLGISKRGDTYLRTLLIHGARSVLMHAKEPGKWLRQIGQRRPPNVVVVALANKLARTIWALLAHGREYDKEHVSVRLT